MVLNEEQQLLKDTIGGFLSEHAPTTALRELRDNPAAPAWSSSLWQQLCEMGVGGLALPEADGGLGFGWLGFGALLEEFGRHLSPAPMLSHVAFATAVVNHCASAEQRSHWLPGMIDGSCVTTVAFQERNHYHCEPHIQLDTQGRLSGRKCLVMDASAANFVLITALREDGSLGICRMPVTAQGLSWQEETLMDGRRYSHLILTDAHMADGEWLAGEQLGEGWQQALDEATLAVACDMAGGARELLERTVAYLSEREQFGVKIGSFQALQHRCALAYAQLELAYSTLLAGLSALDRGGSELAEHASRAKALLGDAYEHISNEAVQLHGGMGVTDEMDIGLFLKRSRVCNQLFGSAEWHRDRFARLRGF